MKFFFYLLLAGLYVYSNAIYKKSKKKKNSKKFFAIKKGKKKKEKSAESYRLLTPPHITPTIIPYQTIIQSIELKLNQEFIEKTELEKINKIIHNTLPLLEIEIREKENQIHATQKNYDKLQEFVNKLNILQANITKQLGITSLIVIPESEIASSNVIIDNSHIPNTSSLNDSAISSSASEDEESDNEE